MENIDGMTKSDLAAELKKSRVKSLWAKAASKYRLIEFRGNQCKHNCSTHDDNGDDVEDADIDEQIRAREKESSDLRDNQRTKSQKEHSRSNSGSKEASGSTSTVNQHNDKRNGDDDDVDADGVKGYENEKSANISSSRTTELKLRHSSSLYESVKLFQSIEMVFQLLGIQVSGPTLKDRVSLKFCFFVMSTVINLVSSFAFFLLEAKSVADCGDSFYQASCMAMMTFHVVTYCWKTLEIHQLIGQFEQFFEKSKLEIFDLIC